MSNEDLHHGSSKVQGGNDTAPAFLRVHKAEDLDCLGGSFALCCLLRIGNDSDFFEAALEAGQQPEPSDSPKLLLVISSC